jgi:hypothetical protein
MIKVHHFWSQKWQFRPHGANPYKRNGFLGLLGSISLISRFGQSSTIWRRNHFSQEMQKVAPSSLKVVRGIIIFGLEMISQAFLRLSNVKSDHFCTFRPTHC